MENRIWESLNKLIKNSSSKYYHYPVAAILECKDGVLFEGVNIETSSPQAGICAERNALFQAIAKGYQKDDFKRFYLYNQTENFITPCFICRQAFSDYCNPNLEIISFNVLGKFQIYRLEELIPNGFGEESLK